MGGLEMVETELEEGGAPLIMKDFDVDEAFSYLDKRIEDLLGHYRKEFEGGFSAETLGARYGGYGSFLPTYQRSPLCPQPRAPSQAQNHSIQKPSHLDNSPIMSGETSLKQEPAPSCAPPVHVLVASSVDSSVKDSRPTAQVSDNKTIKLPVQNFDQRTLKIRIKVGSDNSTLVKKNAAIYNNLGLDMSPSSSSEDDIAEWECNFQDSERRGGESPSRIIKIMTSFPIPNGDLLSPLHDSLIHLEDKKLIDGRSRSIKERAAVIIDEVASVKEVPGEKNGKPGNKKRKLDKIKNEYQTNSANPGIAHFKKDPIRETSAGKKIKSDGLKFLLKSSTRSKVVDTIGSAGRASEAGIGGAKDRIISSNVEKEAVRSVACQEASGKQIAESNLVGKVQKVTKLRYGLKGDGGRNDVTKVGKRSESNLFGEEFGFHKTTEDSLQTMDHPNEKCQQNSISQLDDAIEVQSGMKQTPSGPEKKLKGNQSIFSVGKTKEGFKVGSFAAPKDKNAHGSNPSKNKGDSRSHKDFRKGRSQNDLIGRIKLEKAERRHDPLGTPGRNNEKDLKLEVHEKQSVSFSVKSEKKFGDKVQPKEDPNNAPPSIDPLAANVAPVLDNWVGCDKCEKWRLLPHGRNPNDLPKKWKCSMLDWLPGMNHCSVSEDETTNAVIALCQVPISNVQTTPQTYPEKDASGTTLINAENCNQNTIGRQSKFEINVPSASRHSGSTCILKTAKKKPEDRVKSKNLLNVSRSSLELKSEKISGLDKPLKVKCKREVDEDSVRPLKKEKTDIMPCADEHHNPGRVLKNEIEIDNKQYIANTSMKDTRGMVKDGSVPVIGKSNRQVQRQPTMTAEQHGETTVPGKKRKSKDLSNRQTYIGAKEISETDCREEKKACTLKIQGTESNAWEDYSKPDKKKKVNKILLPGNKGFPREPKSSEKDQSFGDKDRNKPFELIVDKRSSKKDFGDGQPYVAATSSSSMISSTCKVKLNSKEVRGSPVESVCSSPLRTPNHDNLAKRLMNCPTECLPSHREQDDSSQAANSALNEVKVLKHLTDASMSGLKSTVLFFEGALKFLHGASLQDPCSSDGDKCGQMTAAELYNKAAKQCEYCAHEFEKFLDMASASLAYKCMEVAYMRVIYSNDFIASRDRDQLQLDIVAVSPVGSPSSSASDVDNLNNQAIVDKRGRAKDVGSPHMTGNLVIAARNRSNFERLLNYVQHVNLAMEASRKSQIAFTTAKLVLEEAGNHAGISSIRKVLDFSFHDVQELLDLVHFAMDALKS